MTAEQWYRGSTAISGATSSTHTTVAADAHQPATPITVQLTVCDTAANCIQVTPVGMFVVEAAALGAPSYYPMWSHGPVSVNEAEGNGIVSLPTPSYPTATGSLGFSLTWNSQSSAQGSDGLGMGWDLAAGDSSPPSQLFVDGKDGSGNETELEIDWPDGSAAFYQVVVTSTSSHPAATTDVYQPLQPDGSQVIKNTDGTWTYLPGAGSSYLFGVENAAGLAPLQSATIASSSQTQNGQTTYSYDGSGRLTTAIYRQTPTSSSSETLTFNWSCTGFAFCVTGPDGVQWKYSGDANHEITQVNDGTRNLVALTYTGGLVSKIQNADDLDPTHSSPGYNGSHTLTLTYDSSSPKKLTCLTDGPISGQAASPQPSCVGGGSASESTWLFTYLPGASCPTLRAPATSHSVAQGTRVGCTTLTAPDQESSTSVGPGVTVLYDAFYRPLEYDDVRLSSLTPRISLVQYNSQNQIAWSEDPDGNPTDYGYDPLNGELLSTTGPIPDGTTFRPVTKYRYDEQTIGDLANPGNALTGLAGSYWTNTTTPTGQPVSKENDPDPSSGKATFTFTSGSGWPPSSVSGNTTGFAARWTGDLTAPESGNYTFTTVGGSNDGTHFVVNGIDEIQNMSPHTTTASSATVNLTAGSVYPILLEFAHFTGGTSGATITLQWSCTGCSPAIPSGTVVPVSDLAPAWENQTSVVSPAGRVSFQHFLNPASGQPDYSLVQVSGTNLITSYVYDSLGRMTKKYMPKSNASVTVNATTGNLSGTPSTTYETDSTYYGDGTTAAPPAACGGGSAVNQYGQLQTTSIPNGGLHSIVTVYNSAGSPIATTNGKGTSCLSYDAEQRLTKQTALGDQSTAITSTYDPNGTVLTTTNPSGTVTTYYDETGRPNDTTDASGAEAKHTYDPDGDTLSLTANTHALAGNCSTDYCTTYLYDPADELSTETDPAGHAWSFYYDDRGNLRGTQYPNGTFSWVDTDPAGDTTHQYNRHGTITSSTTTPPTDTNPLADYTYAYVDGGSVFQDGKKVSQIAKSGSTSQTTSYVYDNAGRLNQVSLPGNTCRNYSYDLDSNRTQIQQSSTGCAGTFSTTATYTYTPATTPGTDELTSVTQGGTTNYAYTTDGQVSSQGTTSYTWNGFNQPATATVGSNTVTYTYDGTGNLSNRTSSSPSTTTHYLVGDLFETNSASIITTSYTDGPEGDLASYNGPPTVSSTPSYLYYDAHGNLAAEGNSSGTLTANHAYDPFGAPSDTPPTNTTVHRFVGRWNKEYDTTTSDILMGARPYDPETGRFLSVDPIPGGSLNNYDYADQDPIDTYDLNGLSACSKGGWLAWTRACPFAERVGHGIFKVNHVVGKYGEILPYGAYYAAHWVLHKTHGYLLFTPIGNGLIGIEFAGLGGDAYFDMREGAPPCDEHRKGHVPIFHGHFLFGCGHGHLDIP